MVIITVDGKNPAPGDMVNVSLCIWFLYIPGAGSQDF